VLITRLEHSVGKGLKNVVKLLDLDMCFGAVVTFLAVLEIPVRGDCCLPGVLSQSLKRNP